MSYPSFHSYIKTLRGLLKHKQRWLLEESTLLADLCLAYGTLVGLSDRQKRTLFLAAHFKNLGAIFLDDSSLTQAFSDRSQVLIEMERLFKESAQLAREAGLRDVALVLDQYYQRAIPEDSLARIFQVINVWVSCRQRKGWRSSMSDKEALVVLQQRAQMKWSDPKVVAHFIKHLCSYSSRLDGVDAALSIASETLNQPQPTDLTEFDTLQQDLWWLDAPLGRGDLSSPEISR
ncbi:MAG: hypothetical protein KGQ93_11370 [Cyanobacteria bacterium REEB459]|nr:hypothetical protein [Cyanobacteria bacterium REEB459]